MSVLRSIGQAGKHQQWRVRIVPHASVVFGFYYVSRTTHNVVIAQIKPLMQGKLFANLRPAVESEQL